MPPCVAPPHLVFRNQTFQFNVINDNTVTVTVYDEDTMSRDDRIGTCTISLARAREQGQDRATVPLVCSRTGKQHGHITASIRFEPNGGLRPPAAGYAPVGYAPAPYPNYSPAYAAAQYMAQPAPPAYGYAPYAAAPAPYAAAPAPYGYAPQPYAQPQPQPYAPQPAYAAYPAPAPPAYAPAPQAPAPAGYYPGVPSTYPPPIAFGQMPAYPPR